MKDWILMVAFLAVVAVACVANIYQRINCDGHMVSLGIGMTCISHKD